MFAPIKFEEVALLPFHWVASGNAIVPDAIVEVALARFILRLHPVAEFVVTVALEVADTAVPGVSDPSPSVLVESVSVMTWFTESVMV